jgi:signal transduction histidine kinase
LRTACDGTAAGAGVLPVRLLDIPDDELRRLGAENKTLRTKVAAQQSLRDVSRALSLELNLRPLLYMIMDSAAELLRGSAASLLLHDKEKHELVFDVVSGGGSGSLQMLRMPDDSGVPGWVIANQLPLIVNDAPKDPRVRHDIAESVQFTVQAILAVPLMARGKLIGVLEVLKNEPGSEFSGEDLEVLSSFAAPAAIAIENARLISDLREQRDRLIDAEELVRRRLQEELHDGLAQELASMAMKANAIVRQLAHDPAKAAVELGVLEDDLRAAVKGVRNLLFDLRPLVLETQGLTAALELLSERAQSQGGPQTQVDLTAFAGRLDRRSEVSIFGVVQESLNNIVKHAHAHNVWITLEGDPERYTLTIRDDGKGFDPSAVGDRYEQRGSFGLLNMQERAEHLGAVLQIDSRPGNGTQITVAVAPRPAG